MPVKLLDMKPVGHYGAGEPRYAFHTSFPSRGVRAIAQDFDTPKAAYQHGIDTLRKYEAADPYGNMGEVLGVMLHTNGKYRAVINTYHSNT